MAKYSEAELKYARPVANAILESGEFLGHGFLPGQDQDFPAKDAELVGELQASLKKQDNGEPFLVQLLVWKGFRMQLSNRNRDRDRHSNNLGLR